MQTIRRLVPNFIIEKYKANELHGTLEGAAVFVDLVGFSTMVDGLSAHGQAGAEVLAEIMREVFEPLVAAIYEQDGFVIGYAGDAFNAVFPADPAQSPEAIRCLAALVKIQSHMKAKREIATRFGKFPIAIKLGMGYGEVRWQMFKSKEGERLTYWMRGAGLNRAIYAEERASADEIVVDISVMAHIKELVEAEPADDAFKITKILSALPAPGAIKEPTPELSPINLFFPETLLRQPVVGEFRQVVNLFIDIPVNISDEALVTPFMQTVYALQAEYGGFFLRPELGDKGFNLLLIWGAPTARERDLEHAIEFVTELEKRTQVTLRAGLTYRTAYAGFIGSSLREDYTAYGWGITFAARLMTYAKQGEFWVDEEVARRAKDKFEIAYLGEHPIKGFSQKQRVYQILGKKTDAKTIYHGTFVGRKTELKTIKKFIAPLQYGKFSGILLISGEAGIGKSRLLHNHRENEELSYNWISLHAEELIRSALNPFKKWIKKRFDIKNDESNAENWMHFMRILDGVAENVPDPELASELSRTSSVLAALGGLSRPNSLYETLDAKARYENTLLALSAFLRAESLRAPTILVLEDAHWLDNESAAFLDYFIRTLQADDEKAYPLAIIATQRPESEAHFSASNTTAQINVGELSIENIHALAYEIVGKPITDALGKSLSKRAEGNPFFAEQILRYLAEEKLLSLNEDETYTTDKAALRSIPLDVNAVLIARLDRLTQKVRETVQTASVLGREFIVDILIEMLRSQLERLPGYVQEAEQAKIWAHLSEIEYIFSHALLRDAAYAMQLSTHQQSLHAIAFSAIKEVYKANLTPHYGKLAYHAEKGALEKEALQYLQLAGEQALNAYQNREAIDYITRTLALLPTAQKRERFELLIKRIECHYNLGDSAAQVDDLEEIRAISETLNDNSLQARSLIRAAYRTATMGNLTQTLEYLSKTKELTQNTKADNVRLTLYELLPDILMRTGKLKEARQEAEDGLAYAEKMQVPKSIALLNITLGLITLEQEGPEKAKHYQEKALGIARKIKDGYLEGKALNNLALTVGTAQGDHHAAQQYFEQALAVFHEEGNQRGKGLALINLGWISSILGDYQNAMRYYEASLKINRVLGNAIEERYAYINLSASSAGLGLKEESLSWANKALQFAQSAKDRMAEHWAYFYLGHAQLLNNDLDLAKEAFKKSLEIREEINSTEALKVEARAGLAETYAKQKKLQAALEEAEVIYTYTENDSSLAGTEEPLRVYLSLYNIFSSTDDKRASIILENAHNLLKEQLAKLNDAEARRIFVDNVPWRKAIKEKAES